MISRRLFLAIERLWHYSDLRSISNNARDVERILREDAPKNIDPNPGDAEERNLIQAANHVMFAPCIKLDIFYEQLRVALIEYRNTHNVNKLPKEIT